MIPIGAVVLWELFTFPIGPGKLIIEDNTQDPFTYSDIATFTANPITIMLLIHLLAIFDREKATMDVPAAILIPPMADEVHFFASKDPVSAEVEGPPKVILQFYVDASHGLFAGRGIGAFLATLGSALIIAKC